MKNKCHQILLSKIEKNSICLGIKKGYNIGILPDNLYKLYNNIVIRILRFIGGVCLLLVFTSYYLKLPIILHNFIIIIGFIQSMQILIILLIKIIYGIYTLKYKSKEFEVRNSPLNQYATQIARIIYCAKIGCAVTGGTAATIAAGASFDSVLEAAGREKVFVPMLGSLYKSVFGELSSHTQERINNIVNSTEANSDNNVSEMIKNYQSMSDQDRLEFLSEINRELEKK
uniref:Uncharacterized protein n=1 Tax=Mutinus fleischeri TaxID=2218478 RepID=A0A8K1RCS8_9AGAM|nr:hypothetical protein [Mutinus fleischeri]